MSNIGKKKFRDHSSADEERNEKKVLKKYNTRRKGRYSSKNKSAWPDLLQNLEAQMLDNKISYLNRPHKVAAIKAPVQRPNFVVFIPSITKPAEKPHEKEQRDLLENDVLKKMYSDALSRQISELKKLQQDNEVCLSVLLDLVDKSINLNHELHDFKKRTCGTMNPDQQ
jgi:hypothetical protein